MQSEFDNDYYQGYNTGFDDGYSGRINENISINERDSRLSPWEKGYCEGVLDGEDARYCDLEMEEEVTASMLEDMYQDYMEDNNDAK